MLEYTANLSSYSAPCVLQRKDSSPRSFIDLSSPAQIKIITLVGLVILGIILDLGGGPTHDPIGFRYWKNPGPFVQYAGIAGATGRFLGYWAVLPTAAFSFLGTEVVAIAGGEAKYVLWRGI